MNKTILTIMGIFLLASVSAINLYSGECIQEDFSEFSSQNITWIVIDNSSNMQGMNLSMNGTKMNICFDVRFKPDNFTLIFMEEQTREIIKTIHTHSSGGTKIKYVDVIHNITEYINNTIEVPRNCTDCPEPTNSSDVPQNNPIQPEMPLWLKILCVLALTIIVIVFIIGAKKRKFETPLDEDYNNYVLDEDSGEKNNK